MLKFSNVSYNEAEHTYTTPEGKLLSGITGMIDRQINGGKFASMDKEFLRPYAEFGKLVHNEIENYFTVGIVPTTMEALAFIHWAQSNMRSDGVGATEYTVTDNEHFATNIDFVENKEGFYNLYDFKTSAQLNLDTLSWQLSICAELFNLQNGFYPTKLFGVHLRGDKCNVVEVEQKPKDAVFKLLEAETQGQAFVMPYTTEKAEIRQLLDLEQAIIRIKQEADYYEEQKKLLLDGIADEMDKSGLKRFETDTLIITKVLPTISESIDTKRMKTELSEDIWKPFLKTTEKKGYIKLTIKGQAE
jgi:desulfoferrodoxin (superoxide reductase-like protein)